MSGNERRLIEANIKMQDENNDLKVQNARLINILEQIKIYMQINHDKENKVKVESILEIIGDYYA